MGSKKKDTVLVLRTCDAQLRSNDGKFVWPAEGRVEAPDWRPKPSCGNGLHGLLWGEGDGSLLDWSETARWLVVEIPADTLVDLKGKVKFPAGDVVHVGDRCSATEFLAAHPGAAGRAIAGGTSTSGDRGTSTSGDRGTSTSGYRGTSTSGDGGTSTSGYGGTSTSGYGGTSTSGDRGTSTSGTDGLLVIHHYDAARGRYTVKVAEVGVDGIKPDVPYRLDVDGRFVPAEVSS
jgi:hypothetical protein